MTQIISIKSAAIICVATLAMCFAGQDASAQCRGGGFNSGFGGFNSGFGSPGISIGVSSGFRGSGFNSGFGGFNSGFGHSGFNRSFRPSYGSSFYRGGSSFSRGFSPYGKFRY